MRIKGPQGQEIEVNEEWTDARVKVLIKCVSEDAERYRAHESVKLASGYAPPTFPDERLDYHGRRG